MRFKVDENLPAEVAESLRASGHVADTVEDEGLRGAPDEKVVAASAADGRVLFTLDKGIANRLRYPSATHRGVVLFRPKSVGRGAVLVFVREHLEVLTSLPIENRITVVTENGIRIR